MLALRRPAAPRPARRLRHRQRDLLVVGRAGAAGQQQRPSAMPRTPRRRCRLSQPSSALADQLLQSDESRSARAPRPRSIGPPRCSIQPRTRMRRPSRFFGSTPAAAKSPPMRRRMVTVKSRVQRRPKFTYIVAPLSRTDKTLPSTSANWPRSACQPGEIFGRQRGEIGIGPEPAAGRARRRFGAQQSPRRRPCRRPAPKPAPGLARAGLLQGRPRVAGKGKGDQRGRSGRARPKRSSRNGSCRRRAPATRRGCRTAASIAASRSSRPSASSSVRPSRTAATVAVPSPGSLQASWAVAPDTNAVAAVASTRRDIADKNITGNRRNWRLDRMGGTMRGS